jgi:hypothetical protein
MASYGIDSLLVARPYLPMIINNVLPATKILSEISYYSNLAGLVLLVPAVITGFHEWWEIAKFKGENKFVDGVVRFSPLFLFCPYCREKDDMTADVLLLTVYRKFSRTLTGHSTWRRSMVYSTSQSVREIFLPPYLLPYPSLQSPLPVHISFVLELY